jgi:hypothetical protein
MTNFFSRQTKSTMYGEGNKPALAPGKGERVRLRGKLVRGKL